MCTRFKCEESLHIILLCWTVCVQSVINVQRLNRWISRVQQNTVVWVYFFSLGNDASGHLLLIRWSLKQVCLIRTSQQWVMEAVKCWKTKVKVFFSGWFSITGASLVCVPTASFNVSRNKEILNDCFVVFSVCFGCSAPVQLTLRSPEQMVRSGQSQVITARHMLTWRTGLDWFYLLW